jgi:hypothetical protein
MPPTNRWLCQRDGCALRNLPPASLSTLAAPWDADAQRTTRIKIGSG